MGSGIDLGQQKVGFSGALERKLGSLISPTHSKSSSPKSPTSPHKANDSKESVKEGGELELPSKTVEQKIREEDEYPDI